MEDVLDVYQRALVPARPLVCFDEGGKELHGEARDPLPVIHGHAARYDTEYVRHGSATRFLWCTPLLGTRGVTVTERRTRIDFAHADRDQALVHRQRRGDSNPLAMVTDPEQWTVFRTPFGKPIDIR